MDGKHFKRGDCLESIMGFPYKSLPQRQIQNNLNNGEFQCSLRLGVTHQLTANARGGLTLVDFNITIITSVATLTLTGIVIDMIGAYSWWNKSIKMREKVNEKNPIKGIPHRLARTMFNVAPVYKLELWLDTIWCNASEKVWCSLTGVSKVIGFRFVLQYDAKRLA